MTEATFFFIGVAGLGLWAGIVAVFEINTAWKRKRLRQSEPVIQGRRPSQRAF
jgi:hypothetical protein